MRVNKIIVNDYYNSSKKYFYKLSNCIKLKYVKGINK